MGYIIHYLQTTTHKIWVMYYILKVIIKLFWRGIVHDLSKYSLTESHGFAKQITKLQKLTYGSIGYKMSLHDLKSTLDHHYRHNRHHPEHYRDGMCEMGLIDVTEMVCDWQAAAHRHTDGNIHDSIVLNKIRFGFSDDLYEILSRSV